MCSVLITNFSSLFFFPFFLPFFPSLSPTFLVKAIFLLLIKTYLMGLIHKKCTLILLRCPFAFSVLVEQILEFLNFFFYNPPTSSVLKSNILSSFLLLSYTRHAYSRHIYMAQNRTVQKCSGQINNLVHEVKLPNDVMFYQS